MICTEIGRCLAGSMQKPTNAGRAYSHPLKVGLRVCLTPFAAPLAERVPTSQRWGLKQSLHRCPSLIRLSYYRLAKLLAPQPLGLALPQKTPPGGPNADPPRTRHARERYETGTRHAPASGPDLPRHINRSYPPGCPRRCGVGTRVLPHRANSIVAAVSPFPGTLDPLASTPRWTLEPRPEPRLDAFPRR
jgi:hypothetical protein